MSVEPTEIEELRGRVLGIIGAYGMGDSIDPRRVYLKSAPATAPPEPVRVPDGSHISDGSRGTSRIGHGDGSVTRRLNRIRCRRTFGLSSSPSIVGEGRRRRTPCSCGGPGVVLKAENRL